MKATLRSAVRVLLVSWLVLVAAGCSVESDEQHRMYGVCYSPYRGAQAPGTRLLPSEREVDHDLAIISQFTGRIRTYSSTGGNRLVPAVAERHGLRVAQGVWLREEETLSDRAANVAEVEAAIRLARAPSVESIIVGNEVQLFGYMDVDRHIRYVEQVRSGLRGIGRDIPVSCADAWNQFQAKPELVDALDFITMHMHPYWHGMVPQEGVKRLVEIWEELSEQFPDKQVVVGETGYPSAGEVNRQAVPSVDTALDMLRRFASAADELGIPYYYFEFADEIWKSKGKPDSPESHWGLFHNDRRPKFPASVLPRSDALVYFAGCLSHPYGLEAVLLSGVQGGESGGTAPDNVLSVFSDGGLAEGLDMGINTSGSRTDWLAVRDGTMLMSYPAGQNWGAAFITVGEPVDHPRPGRDFSGYDRLVIEMRGHAGGESVDIGIKDNTDLDNGRETKITEKLSTDWQDYEFSLPDFRTADLTRLYVVTEFVFDGKRSVTVEVRSIRLIREQTPVAPEAPRHPAGPDLRARIPEVEASWVVAGDEVIIMGSPAEPGHRAVLVSGEDQEQDILGYTKLVIEMRGDKGGEVVAVGITARADPDCRPDTLTRTELTADWAQYEFDLTAFRIPDLARVRVAIAFVFDVDERRPVEVRSIRFVG